LGRTINKKRVIKGHYYNLFYDMKTLDKEHFVKYIRMSPECFYTLFILIKHKFTKRVNRETISPEHRLVITLL